MSSKKFNSFKEFYPFYLSEHKKTETKLFHMIGTIIVILLFGCSIIAQNWLYIYFTPLAGYSFAWFSHFHYEKNKPATFKYPIYSFIGDWVMFKEIITGEIKL